MSCALWELPGGRRALLLGDHHFSREYMCPGSKRTVFVADFLDRLATERADVDIYLEGNKDAGDRVGAVEAWVRRVSRRPDRAGADEDAPLRASIRRFRRAGCFDLVRGVKKEACAARFRGRIHDVDMRWRGSQVMFTAWDELRVAITEWGERKFHQGTTGKDRESRRLLAWLDKYGKASSVRKLIRAEFRRNKTEKQVARIADPKLRAPLEGILRVPPLDVSDSPGGFQRAMGNLRRLASRPMGPSLRDWEKLMDVSDEAFNAFVISFMWVMDAYALGRMLRDYDGGETARRMVVYAGDAHIRNYEEYFARVGGKRVSACLQEKARCVNVPLQRFLARGAPPGG